MNEIPLPDHGENPLQTSCEHRYSANPSDLYEAWTSRFDSWFAQAGTVEMVAEPGRPYFFYNRDDWGRHPHYGRFLKLIENELVEMTWLTGDGQDEGTQGAETILRIEISPDNEGAKLRLTHSGFPNRKSRDGHAENWPLALQILEEALGGQAAPNS